MRLISCHIDGFGKFIDFDIDFQMGLTQIFEDNGWGKSTLAAFIRVMLYGFDTVRGNEVTNEKKRFEPWGESTAYGGRLVFSVGDKEYAIERSFSVGKNKRDSIEVYDNKTNLRLSNFSEKPGEDIFEINSESFKNTIFIGQAEVLTSPTSDIQAKIGGIKDHLEDIGNFEKKDRVLHDLLNALSPSRKTGKINKLNVEISNHYGKEAEAESLEIALVEKGNELYQLKKEKERKDRESKDLIHEQKIVAKYKDRELLIEERRKIEKKIEEADKELREKKSVFLKGVPTLEEISLVEDRTLEVLRLNEILGIYDLTEEEKVEKERLSERFSTGLPSEEELKSQNMAIHKWNEIVNKRREQGLSYEEREAYSFLSEKFENYLPSAEEVANVTEKYRCLGEIRNRLFLLEERKKTEKKRGREERMKKRWLLFFSLIFALGGLLTFFTLKFLGIAISSIGSLLFVFSGFVKAEGKKDADMTTQEIRKLEKELQVTEGLLRDFFENLKEAYSEEGSLDFIYKTQTDLTSFKALSQRAQTEKLMFEEETELENEVRLVFEKYGLYCLKKDNAEARLRDLIFEKSAYQELLKKEKKTLQIQSDIRDLEDEIQNFFRQYQIERKKELKGQLSDLAKLVTELDTLEENLIILRKEREIFLQENREIEFLEPLQENRLSLEELNERQDCLLKDMDVLKAGIITLETEILEMEHSLEELKEVLSEKREKEREKAELSHKYEILKKTKAFLKEAKEQFLSKYRNPMKEAFLQYYQKISEDEKAYELDADLNLQVKEGGKRRDLLLLSKGYQDLVSFCRRLSMVASMYPEEKPFLIMDDPFVNLDKDKFLGGRRLLLELAEEYQIIYFYCHESRKI